MRVGRSRSTTAPMANVKIIWHCSTTAASPAGRPRCMAVNSSPNWPALMNSPMPTMTRHGASGFGTRNTSGTATSAKRSATSTSGSVSRRPRSIATKFTPQITATSRPSSEMSGSHGTSLAARLYAAPVPNRSPDNVRLLHDRSPGPSRPRRRRSRRLRGRRGRTARLHAVGGLPAGQEARARPRRGAARAPRARRAAHRPRPRPRGRGPRAARRTRATRGARGERGETVVAVAHRLVLHGHARPRRSPAASARRRRRPRVRHGHERRPG